ncbi:hypothetical protein ILUMI_01291, partial [Ignelater luminosus]
DGDVPTLRLRLKKPKSDKKVQWTTETIDNEDMNKKKSKSTSDTYLNEDDSGKQTQVIIESFQMFAAVNVEEITVATLQLATIYKARLVARGFEQDEGLEINENYENKVCLLNKAIYGLKQAPKIWNERFNTFMSSLNFKRSKSDYCLFVFLKQNIRCYLLLYLDDILLACNDKNFINYVKSKLCETFKMKKLDFVNNFLGIRICKDFENKIITIDQISAINNLVKRFNVENCKNFKTPIENNLVLERNCDENLKTKLPYKELLGSLMYIMMGTRPDICYCVSYFGRYQDCATDVHFKHLLRVLKYLKFTVDLKLSFCCSDNDLQGFSDADWANDADRKSLSNPEIQIEYQLVVSETDFHWAQKVLFYAQCSASTSKTRVEIVSDSQENNDNYEEEDDSRPGSRCDENVLSEKTSDNKRCTMWDYKEVTELIYSFFDVIDEILDQKPSNSCSHSLNSSNERIIMAEDIPSTHAKTSTETENEDTQTQVQNKKDNVQCVSEKRLRKEYIAQKKKKSCCIYSKPRKFDESSSSEDSDDECDHCHGHVEKKKHKKASDLPVSIEENPNHSSNTDIVEPTPLNSEPPTTE